MPVLLDRADFEPWLSGAAGTELFKPAAEDRLRMWPVSRLVNRTGGGDDPALIGEIAASPNACEKKADQKPSAQYLAATGAA
jgi:hypothetical protein